MEIFLFDLSSEKKNFPFEWMCSRNFVAAYHESKVTAEKSKVLRALSKSPIAIVSCL